MKFLLLLLVFAHAHAGQADPLSNQRFSFQAEDPDRVLADTVGDLRAMFRHFRPKFDSGTKVIKPVEVSGSRDEPSLTVSVRKCVLFWCRDVKLDATMQLREVSGKCRRQYVLVADLTRSSALIADYYSALRVDVCYEATGESGSLATKAVAERAPSYGGGLIANIVFQMLELQVAPLTSAITRSLEQSGGKIK